MQRRLITVDLLAGLGALLWAVVALLLLPGLAGLVDPSVAGGFALVALGRWYWSLAGRRRAGDGPVVEHVIERWSDESVPIDLEPANGDPSGPEPEAP